MISNKLKLVADFETTTRNEEEQVWLWDVCRINDLAHVSGDNLNDFFKFINGLNVAADIYFHNLKFDGSFIINHLLKNGCKLNQSENIKTLKKGELSTLITEMCQFFKITIKNKKGKFIHFIDSLKVIPFSAEKIAKDFQLNISKGEIDYDKPRPDGYQPTPEEVTYCRTDTEIIAEAMGIMLREGYDKLTLSSNAFEIYKKLVNKGDWTNWFGEWEESCDLALDRNIRESYRGGFCQANPLYINKTIKQPTYYFDVNSLYPYVMSSYAMPYGMPVEFEGLYETDSDYPLFVQEIEVNMEVKPDHVPCILLKSDRRGNDYIIDTVTQQTGGSLVKLTVTNYDLDMIYKNYEIYEIKYLRGWKFKAREHMFTDYVKKFYKMKVDADKTGNRVKRTIAKLFMNSLYGKFGQNPKRAKKYPKLVDGVIKLKYNVECDDSEPLYRIAKKFHYLPVAVFVTSIARHIIVNDILTIGVKNWLYSDTDSIVSLVPLPNNRLSQTKLGKYKKEHVMKKFKCLAQKTYYGVDITGKAVVAIAGCSKKALKNLPFGKFEYFEKGTKRRQGMIANGRTCLRTCVGGKKVTFSDFCLRDKRVFLNRRETWDELRVEIDEKVFGTRHVRELLLTRVSHLLLNKLTCAFQEDLSKFNENNKNIVDFDDFS